MACLDVRLQSILTRMCISGDKGLARVLVIFYPRADTVAMV